MKIEKSRPRKLGALALLVAGGMLMGSTLSGCSLMFPKATDGANQPSSTVTATPNYVVGTPINVNDGHGNAAKVTILSAKYTDEKPGKNTPAPKNGKYLTLEILWEETSGKMMAGSSYINARDVDGNRVSQVLFADNTLPMGYVITGDKSKGIVAFDVKPGPVSVIFSDMTLLNEYARVKLTL